MSQESPYNDWKRWWSEQGVWPNGRMPEWVRKLSQTYLPASALSFQAIFTRHAMQTRIEELEATEVELRAGLKAAVETGVELCRAKRTT